VLYEPKWDGFRAIVYRDGDEVILGSRNERPMTRYFPELVESIRTHLPRRCVVDGEIVIVGEDGGLGALGGIEAMLRESAGAQEPRRAADGAARVELQAGDGWTAAPVVRRALRATPHRARAPTRQAAASIPAASNRGCPSP
jgi:ATP dependent DNA ligase-like protein